MGLMNDMIALMKPSQVSPMLIGDILKGLDEIFRRDPSRLTHRFRVEKANECLGNQYTFLGLKANVVCTRPNGSDSTPIVITLKVALPFIDGKFTVMDLGPMGYRIRSESDQNTEDHRDIVEWALVVVFTDLYRQIEEMAHE